MGFLFLQQLESKLGPSDWERVWTAPAYIKRRFTDIAAADTAVDAKAFKVFLVPFDSENSCIESLTSGFKGVTTWLDISSNPKMWNDFTVGIHLKRSHLQDPWTTTIEIILNRHSSNKLRIILFDAAFYLF
jgi:hypothetical protein